MTGSKTILIVEDYADIATVYSFMLESNGYSVQVAKDGEEALAKVLEIEPAVIFLDIMLPKVDGFVVLRTIKSDPKYAQIHSRIVLLSNLQQQDIPDKTKLAGADCFAVKANLRNTELVAIAQQMCAKFDAATAGDTTPFVIDSSATPSLETIEAPQSTVPTTLAASATPPSEQ